MSAGSLRERVAPAVKQHWWDEWDEERIDGKLTPVRYCACEALVPFGSEAAHLADAALAEVREWLGSNDAREVVADAICVSTPTRLDRALALAALAVLIDQTKEAPTDRPPTAPPTDAPTPHAATPRPRTAPPEPRRPPMPEPAQHPASTSDSEKRRRENATDPCSRCGSPSVANPKPDEDLVVCEPCEVAMWRDLHDDLHEARAELTRLRETVARVEALADDYAASAASEGHGGELWSTTDAALRAALRGDS